ncbi:Aste57867_17833 [Aphanomyces stellatus]|uniref:Aste57867_17833 protein n=1 Tax=Aphanomyces stellatus TaxID=120398 RepID=A0A485L986_9STRA|nr:hypothetical protein As57867_017772 [Aphanomyces stellatus]VFT94576.1 Aste57867_17833 [Aphanomyces stellatus]
MSTPTLLPYTQVQDDPPVHVRTELWALLSLAAPMSITMLLDSLATTISVALVGRLDGPNATELIAGAALSSMYTSITTIGVGIGLTTALDTFGAQAVGSGNLAKMGVYLQSALLAMALVFVPVFLLHWFCRDILIGLGQDPIAAAHAGRFTMYITIGVPFFFAYEVVRKLIQSHSIIFPMTAVALLANVVHVVAGIFLVQSMGFNGAALARLLSMVSYPIFLALYLWFNPVHTQWVIQWRWATATANLRDFFVFGFPAMLMMVLELGAFEILTILSGLLPNSLIAVGASSVLMNIVSFIYTMYFGMAIAAGIRVGLMVGANQLAHAQCVIRLAYTFFIGAATLTAILLFSLRHHLPSLYVSDPDIIARAASTIVYILPLHLLDVLNALSQAVLRALGKPALAASVNAGAYYLLGLPVAALFAFVGHWNLPGLWGGFSIGSLVGCVLYAYLIPRLDWDAILDETKKRNDINQD